MPLVLNSESFRPLLEPMSTLNGIGEKQSAYLSELCGGNRIIDLLTLIPHRYIDRTNIVPIGRLAAFFSQNEANIIPVIEGRVVSVSRPPQRSRAPLRIRLEDPTGKIDIAIFNSYFTQIPEEGSWLAVSGALRVSQGKLSMGSPNFITPLPNKSDEATSKRDTIPIPAIEPVWPLTADIKPYMIRRGINQALPLAEHIPEWHDLELLKEKEWPSFYDALATLHNPSWVADCPDWEKKISKAKERLAADELLADQLCLQTARHFSKKVKGQSIPSTSKDYQKQLWKNFGHQPTEGQIQAIREIIDDLRAPHPMMRLLQGDVGSGKTMAAFTAMAFCADAGLQSALMAPTEILAKQHYELLLKLLGEGVVLLTGSTSTANRKQVLTDIASGKAKFIIGTHALFQDEVQYKDLALAIIDEQHRFGVEQREKLSKKSNGTNVLLMSATPIPRTLQITQWGGIEVSQIAKKPSSRIPTVTTLHSIHKIEPLITSLKRALSKGEQVFWVCPLVEENEDLSVTAVEERYTSLQKSFPGIVGLAHGRQTAEDRAKALNDFKDGKTKILVATTVIEVGVDVPQANIIVIEHAERFGLAQLHQLRGRVGRGSSASHCLLLYGHDAGDLALKRLGLLKVTDDGFRIADEDFRLRGGGEMTGTKQAGLKSFKIADPLKNELLLEEVTNEAEAAIKNDPSFKSQRGEHLAGLMYLFNRHEPEKVLFTG